MPPSEVMRPFNVPDRLLLGPGPAGALSDKL